MLLRVLRLVMLRSRLGCGRPRLHYQRRLRGVGYLLPVRRRLHVRRLLPVRRQLAVRRPLAVRRRGGRLDRLSGESAAGGGTAVRGQILLLHVCTLGAVPMVDIRVSRRRLRLRLMLTCQRRLNCSKVLIGMLRQCRLRLHLRLLSVPEC